MKSKGFTLIELLVVIAIIGVLASVIMASLNSARDKGKIAVAKQQMVTIVKGMTIAQGESNKTILSITGNGCSNCACRPASFTPQSPGCYTSMLAAFTAIQNATNGLYGNIVAMVRDPWGNPYLLDENQGEHGNCLNVDSFRSAGPDGIFSSADDIASPLAIPLSPICP